MSTITVSNTWRHRIDRARRLARRAGAAVVVAGAVLGLATAVKVFLVAAHPDAGDVAAIAHRIDNQRDAAGQFAADFVAAVLTTPLTDHAALQRFLTPAPAETAPPAAHAAPAPAVIDTPKVWSVTPQGSA